MYWLTKARSKQCLSPSCEDRSLLYPVCRRCYSWVWITGIHGDNWFTKEWMRHLVFVQKLNFKHSNYRFYGTDCALQWWHDMLRECECESYSSWMGPVSSGITTMWPWEYLSHLVPNLLIYIDYSRRTTVLARRVILGIRSASSSRHCYQVPGTIEDAEYLDLVVYLEPGTVDDSKCSFWCHQLISIWHAAALVTATYGRSDYTVLPFFIVRHWFHGDDRDGYFYHIFSILAFTDHFISV